MGLRGREDWGWVGEEGEDELGKYVGPDEHM